MHLAWGQPKQVAVALAVNPNGVTGGHDLRDERGAALHLLADEEERGRRSRAREDLEHRRRATRVGPIVEGQRVTAPAGRPVLDAQARAQRGDPNAQRRRPIGGHRNRCNDPRTAMIVGGHG
jgi:hypothetical protein